MRKHLNGAIALLEILAIALLNVSQATEHDMGWLPNNGEEKPLSGFVLGCPPEQYWI
ncbi:hypothetical protein IQ238_00720 [Pleurocapsales cyanobacterium LEGE 06147]|nr:hypothetical protein [Pleurocapsales cyanobacterium LEGE 06147]